MDENLYRALKQLQSQAQAMTFALPFKDSAVWLAMKLDASEDWRFPALIEHLLWFEKKIASAETAIYMQGKE